MLATNGQVTFANLREDSQWLICSFSHVLQARGLENEETTTAVRAQVQQQQQQQEQQEEDEEEEGQEEEGQEQAQIQ